MADEKKKEERKPIKIGTHGRTTQSFRTARPKPAEYVEPKPTLRDKDPKEWKAKKAAKKIAKDRARAQAKKLGHRVGSWEGSVAACKDCGLSVRFDGAELPADRDAAATKCGGS